MTLTTIRNLTQCIQMMEEISEYAREHYIDPDSLDECIEYLKTNFPRTLRLVK